MHNNIMAAGPYTPTIVTTPDVPATENSPAVPEQTTVEIVMNMTHIAHFELEKEAIHLILPGIGDEIYSTVDACQTAQEMWEAIDRLQQGNGYQERDKNKEKIRQNQAQDWKEHEITSPTVPSDFNGPA
ncbi:hypothetical protein Tco_1453408, partial [Tanacetum coccineum]